ncbi:hypothetical protein ABH948_004053 [Bacillus sp. RC218]
MSSTVLTEYWVLFKAGSKKVTYRQNIKLLKGQLL